MTDYSNRKHYIKHKHQANINNKKTKIGKNIFGHFKQ